LIGPTRKISNCISKIPHSQNSATAGDCCIVIRTNSREVFTVNRFGADPPHKEASVAFAHYGPVKMAVVAMHTEKFILTARAAKIVRELHVGFFGATRNFSH
jgi:hypothetical protein